MLTRPTVLYSYASPVFSDTEPYSHDTSPVSGGWIPTYDITYFTSLSARVGPHVLYELVTVSSNLTRPLGRYTTPIAQAHLLITQTFLVVSYGSTARRNIDFYSNSTLA